MRPEVKYKLIEKLILIEDDELLSQVEAILEGSSQLNEDLKQELDRRMIKFHSGESKLYTWNEVKDDIQKSK
ncbi:MAG TPA: addiction module protein [Cytophagales bacterium]|nr:addiction module protein [Cytophagales bacterium]